MTALLQRPLLPSMPPPDAELERALRSAVQTCFQNDDMDSLTVKRIRASVATALHLGPDFFKDDAKWNHESKTIIKDEVETQENLRDEEASADNDDQDEDADEDEDIPSKGRTRNAPPAQRAASDEENSGVSIKRKPHPASQSVKPRKRQKIATPVESSDSGVLDDASEVEASPSPPPKKRKTPAAPQPTKTTSCKGRKSTTLPLSVDSDASEDEQDQRSRTEKVESLKASTTPKKKRQPTNADDESDMSSVLDESPPAKRKKQSSSSDAPAKSKKAGQSAKEKPSKPKKAAPSVSPQDEEIKRLQSWLVKCGIRKVWGTYLKPYATPRDKITHLKAMLSDAGMDGRFSEDKARAIKERRELAADLEAVKEGEKNWGVDEDEAEGGRPKRRLAKGLAELAQFDDEDTDSD